MIKSIRLERFKKFRNMTVDLGPFTVLMGENSSGKTTILQALNLSLVTLNSSSLVTTDNQGNIRIRSKGVGLTRLPGIEVSDFRELYYGKRSRASRTEKWIGAKIFLTDSQDNVYRLQVTSLFGGFNVKCTSAQEDLLSNPNIHEKPPLLISGFVGLSASEERVFPVALIDRLRSGHVSSVIRNLVLDTKIQEPQKYERLRRRLADDFDFYLDSVSFDGTSDLYVTGQYSEKLEERSLALDFNASGSGFMQVLQILAPIYRFCPDNADIVLLDEPDAHLHPNLQMTLANSLRLISEELGIQVVISTHSTAIIRSATPSEVVPISEHTSHCHPLVSKNEIEDEIRAKIDSYSLAKTIISGKVAFFEDSDLSLWKRFDEVLNTRVFKGANTIPVISGRGKTDRVPFQIRDVLRELIEEDVEVIYIRDGDGIPTDWRQRLSEYAEENGVKLRTLNYFETESYLLKPRLILRALKDRNAGRDLPGVEDLQAIIDVALKDTIVLARYNYDDCLEEEIHQAATLMKDPDYRDFQRTKSEVRKRRAYLEELTSSEDLLEYGQGKEALSIVMSRINQNYGLKLGKRDLIRFIDQSDIPEDAQKLLRELRSRDVRESPKDSSPADMDEEQDEIETQIEGFLFDFQK